MALGALSGLAPATAANVQPTPKIGYSEPDDAFDGDLENELRMLVGYFQESEDQTTESRRASEQCRDYFDNHQYTSAELATLRRRGQAPVLDNFIQRKIQTLQGVEMRSRSDPKAFPRNPDDEQTANAATDALRFACDQVRFNSTRSTVYGDILVEGTGAAEVLVEQNAKGDIGIPIKRVPWDRLFWDPHSRELNFSDAAYKGIVIWMDAKAARRKWPDFADSVELTISSTSVSDTYDDRPKYTWCDSKRKRVRIVQCHYERDGDWWVATFTKGGFLEEPTISPYLDKDGRHACPLIMRSGFCDRENSRYGHCASLLSLQDEINKRRSKALHLLSARQTYGNKTAIQDVKAAKLALANPDGHVEINGGAKFGEDFGILPTGDMAAGQFEMLQQAQAAMNANGANAAVQGKDERNQSGIALKTRIAAGATELEPQTDGLREWTHEVMEAVWMRIRQFWTDEKWVRVTDDDRNVKFVGLNKQVTLGDKLEQLQQTDPQAAQALGQQLGIQSPYDPKLRKVVEVENNVSGLDVDIVLEEGPDLATLQSEQFEQLLQLAGAPFMNTPSGPAISPVVILKASSLRNKDALIEEQKKHQQAMQQGGQAKEQMDQIAGAETQANVEKTKADTVKALADAELSKAKTQQINVETHVDGVSAMQAAQAGHQMNSSVPMAPPVDPNQPQPGQAPQGPMQ